MISGAISPFNVGDKFLDFFYSVYDEAFKGLCRFQSAKYYLTVGPANDVLARDCIRYVYDSCTNNCSHQFQSGQGDIVYRGDSILCEDDGRLTGSEYSKLLLHEHVHWHQETRAEYGRGNSL